MLKFGLAAEVADVRKSLAAQLPNMKLSPMHGRSRYPSLNAGAINSSFENADLQGLPTSLSSDVGRRVREGADEPFPI